jgi:hypothetical protein
MAKKTDGKEKFELFWEENVTDDVEAIDAICYNASYLIGRDLLIHFNSGANGVSQYHILAGWFAKVYEAILTVMKGLTSQYSEFTVNICDRFFIQFSDGTSDEEMDEKEGNYVFSMIYSDKSPKRTEFSEDQNAEERCVQWETENILSQPELINKIKIQAMKNLRNDLDIALEKSSCVMPIFIYIFDCFMDYYEKIIQTADSDYNGDPEFNFCNCFIASGNYDIEENKWRFGFRPCIVNKLGGKDDLNATSKYE